MVVVTERVVSDEFITIVTREVPSEDLSQTSTSFSMNPAVDVATEVAAAASPLTLAAMASAPAVAIASVPVASAAVVSTSASLPRGKLYDVLKMAVATGFGLVLGAGIMYVYLRSFSKIGKEINNVVQSVNSLKAEVEEMKKNYRLRKRRSLSSGATSRSSDDEGPSHRRGGRQVEADAIDGEDFQNHRTASPINVADAENDGIAPAPLRLNASVDRVSRESSVEGAGGSGSGSGSVYTTASERRDRRLRSASRSTNGFESTDALFDLPPQLLDLIDAVDPLFDGDSNDKAKAHDLLQECAKSLNTYPDFLWRYAKACHVIAQIKGAAGDADMKKDLLFQAYDCAREGLAMRSDDADVQKWYAITLGSIGDYQGTQERILNGFKFKDHIQYAITLRPDDPTLHYLLGRWCYAVYMLSWWERRAAAALFAEPPSASIQEALDHFLEAERLKRTAWKGNKLMIAKCYIELNDLEKVRKNLSTALSMTVVDQDDIDAQQEITSLISKYGQTT